MRFNLFTTSATLLAYASAAVSGMQPVCLAQDEAVAGQDTCLAQSNNDENMQLAQLLSDPSDERLSQLDAFKKKKGSSGKNKKSKSKGKSKKKKSKKKKSKPKDQKKSKGKNKGKSKEKKEKKESEPKNKKDAKVKAVKAKDDGKVKACDKKGGKKCKKGSSNMSTDLPGTPKIGGLPSKKTC